MEKVLIITYYWPPSGGAGVQRWLRFSKYLPQLGWEPVILTIDPEYAAYPVLDVSLEKDVPQGIKVFRTKATDWYSFYASNKSKIPSAGFAKNNDNSLKEKLFRFIRGNLFIPDPRRGWNKYAYRKASEIIESEGIKYIITTSPPHSTQLVGLKLKNKYPGIKWIADLRDPWTDIYYYNQFYHTFISKIIDRKLENQVLRSTDKIITVGKSLKDLFAAKVPGIKNKIEVITNGFDEDDFKDFNATNPDKFTISYIGTLSDSYPVRGFLDALHGFREKGNDFNLKFIGTVSPVQKELILSKTEKSSVEFIPYVDHAIAIKYMLDTDALLLIIPDHQSNKSIITGKLFEYIASGKPVICLGPVDGDAAEIIKEAGNGHSYKYDDISGIEAFLTTLISKPGIYNSHASSGFNRKNLTSQLVRMLNII